MLTYEDLVAHVTYDPETGRFTNKRTGMPAGYLNAGYRLITLKSRRYQAHRLAWLYVHCEWPRFEIDHINGHKADNRIANLRDVPRAINAQNLRDSMPKRLRDAPLGVSWHAGAKKWRAMIWNGSKNLYLGLHTTPEEAHAAYLEAKRRIHPGCTI